VNQPIVLILLAAFAGYLLIRMLLKSRPALTPEEANTAVKAGTAVVVDVREPDEWREGVAAPAVLLPLSDLRGPRKSWRPFLEKHRGKRIFLYCQSGGRSGMAASLLKAEGFDTANLGGFSAWVASGLPTRRP
jgi:rhodanese-related sulfurtransferase